MTREDILNQSLNENEVLAEKRGGLISKYEIVNYRRSTQYKVIESYYMINSIYKTYSVKDYLSGIEYGLNEINIIKTA